MLYNSISINAPNHKSCKTVLPGQTAIKISAMSILNTINQKKKKKRKFRQDTLLIRYHQEVKHEITH